MTNFFLNLKGRQAHQDRSCVLLSQHASSKRHFDSEYDIKFSCVDKVLLTNTLF